MTEPWRKRVVDQALLWPLTPYHHQGRVMGRQGGVDCAMLLADVYHKAGLIPYVDPRPYPIDWHLHRSEERFKNWVEQFAVQIQSGLQPADIILTRYGRCHSHGAIVIEVSDTFQVRVVHAVRILGQVADEWLDINSLLDREPLFYTFKEPE